MREGTIYAILYAVAWIFFFFIIRKKYGSKSVCIFVSIFYVVYSILAVVLYNYKEYSAEFKTLTLLPYIYLYLMILLSLKPIISFDSSQVRGVVEPNPLLVRIFTYGFILLALFLLPSAIAQVSSGLSVIVFDSSGGADLYAEAHGNGIIKRSLADVPEFLFAMFSEISILIFYYYLTQSRLKRVTLIALSITMLYSILRPISLGARAGATMTIFSMLAGYVLMRRWIPHKRRVTLLMIGFFVGALLVIIIMLLSISRFANSTPGVSGVNLNYIAQSSLNFNNYGLDAGGIRNGDRTCRIFKEFMGFDNVPSGVVDRRNKYRSMKMNDSVFYTYVGDFTLDFGPIVTVFVFLFFSLWFTHISCARNGVITFSKLLIVYLSILIPLHGGMYLFTFSDGGNYTLMAFVFTILLFAHADRTHPCKILWAYKEREL